MIYILYILFNLPHSEATPNSKITGPYNRLIYRLQYILKMLEWPYWTEYTRLQYMHTTWKNKEVIKYTNC
jgi:hypothetical protein